MGEYIDLAAMVAIGAFLRWQMASLERRVTARVDRLETRFEARFDRLEVRVADMDRRLARLEGSVGSQNPPPAPPAAAQ